LKRHFHVVEAEHLAMARVDRERRTNQCGGLGFPPQPSPPWPPSDFGFCATGTRARKKTMRDPQHASGAANGDARTRCATGSRWLHRWLL